MKPSAEETGEDFLLQVDADGNPLGRAQKAVLLANQAAIDAGQGDRNDIARIRGAEGHVALALARVGEHGHEQAFAGKQSFSRPHELVHESATTTGRC